MSTQTTDHAVDIDDEFDETPVDKTNETVIVDDPQPQPEYPSRQANIEAALIDAGWKPGPTEILEMVKTGKVTPERLRGALTKAGKGPGQVDEELKLFKEYCELNEVPFEPQTHQPPAVPGEKTISVHSQTPSLTNKVIPFQIKRAAQQSRFINMLLYGSPGVGKTYFAGTTSLVPEMRDVLYVDAEGGTLPISDFDLDVIPVSDWTQFARIEQFIALHCQLREAGDLDSLRKLESKFRGEEVETPRQYRTVIIDSITEVQKYCMYHLLGVNIGEQALDMDWDNPEFKEWGQAAELVRLLARKLRDLPVNVIFCALQQKREDKQKRQEILPSLPGKLAPEFPGFFDITGYLGLGNDQVDVDGKKVTKTIRRLLIQPEPLITAKNRLADDSIRYLDNPSMSDLLKVATKLKLKGNKQ